VFSALLFFMSPITTPPRQGVRLGGPAGGNIPLIFSCPLPGRSLCLRSPPALSTVSQTFLPSRDISRSSRYLTYPPPRTGIFTGCWPCPASTAGSGNLCRPSFEPNLFHLPSVPPYFLDVPQPCFVSSPFFWPFLCLFIRKSRSFSHVFFSGVSIG